MKRIFLLFLILLLSTIVFSQDYPHFEVEKYNYGNFYQPKGKVFRQDSLYYFVIYFKNFDFLQPVKKMLQKNLSKEVYQKYDLEGNPRLGDIYFLYNDKGKLLRLEFSILSNYVTMFPDSLLWSIYKKLKKMRLDLPPVLGGIIKRYRNEHNLWTTDDKGNTVICTFGRRVDKYEFFPLSCVINRQVDFGIRRRNQEL